MSTIIINGTRIQTSGNNISVVNGTVYVDGKIALSDLYGDVNIKFEGDLAFLKCDGSAEINGSIKGNVDVGGSLECGDIGGNIDAGGSVRCGKVSGDIDAGGSVKCSR